jgi:hypothetical protein
MAHILRILKKNYKDYGRELHHARAGYFSGVREVPECSTIISKSGESIGEYDFFFEWFKEPTEDALNNLIEKIDETLTRLGAKYKLMTK